MRRRRRRAEALLLLVIGTTGCAMTAPSGAPPSASTTAGPPLSVGPFLQPADLDRLLPNPSVLVDRGPWSVSVPDEDTQLLRGGCPVFSDDRDTSPTAAAAAGPPPTGSVTQVWRHNGTPEVASLDVLRWSDGEGPRAWVDAVVGAAGRCGESAVLSSDETSAGLPVTAVVRRWEGPRSGGTVDHPALPQWRVEAVVVSGTTVVSVQVGAFSATTAQGAWDAAEPATTGLVDLAAERVATDDAARTSG